MHLHHQIIHELVESGVHLKVNSTALFPKQTKKFIVHRELDDNVVIVKMFPGINENVLSAIMAYSKFKRNCFRNLWFWKCSNRRLVYSNFEKSN